MLGPPTAEGARAEEWGVTVANRGSEPRGGLPPGVEHAKVDRGDADGMGRLIEELQPDAVVDLSCYEPEWARNTIAALGEGWEGRYVLMSSGAVYPETETVPIGEETEPVGRPLWGDYGEKKVEIERIFRGSPVAERTFFLRPPYIVGENDFMGRLQFVFDRLAAGIPVLVPDSGKACVQLVSPEDVAAATVRLLAAPPEHAGACNVGPPRVPTLRSLVLLCAEALGVEALIEEVPLEEAGLTDSPYSWADAFFPFADSHYALDASRLDAVIGKRRYEPLAELVGRTAAAHRSQPNSQAVPEEAPSEIRVRRRRGLPGLATRRSDNA